MSCSWIEIEANRLRSNIAAFRKVIAPSAALMVVVKANAYGHGLETVAPVVAGEADWLGVNSIDEALVLERLGLGKPIFILGHTPLEHAEALVRSAFRQAIYRIDVAEALSSAAQKAGTRAHIHIKVETGTNRQGIPLSELGSFVSSIRCLPSLSIEGVYTHFANIEDTLDPSFAQLQIRRFNEALTILEKTGGRPPHIHTSATAGVLLYPETHFTMVRVGIGVYGVWPSRETQIAARERGRLIPLAPVLTWKARIVQIKAVEAGEYVGYGLTFRASRPMKLAVVPVGYFDGYDRKLSNCGRALVHGQPVPVVGRVAMNMTMLDATETEAAVDDEVVLLGRQGASEIRVEEIAEKVGTIPYEILSRINPTLPRHILHG